MTTSPSATTRTGCSTRWPGATMRGNVTLGYRPVVMRTLTNEVSVIPPQKRVY